MASSSSRTKARASSSSQAGGDLMKSKRMNREDFEKKQPICEMEVDLDELDQAYPGIMALFEVQGWISAVSTQPEAVSPYALREVSYNMDRVNKFHITSKIGTSKFVLKSSQIAEFLKVPEDGDELYFDNIRSEQLFVLVSREDLEKMVCQPGISFTNPMHANNLTPMAYVLWQIMVSNILPQTGHTTELSYFAVYTLYGILTGRKINLPMLILNHLMRCRNQKRASLPYARMITALIQKSSVKIKSSEIYNAMVKTINVNSFLCRNVLRRDGNVYTHVDPKKRKINDPTPPGSSSPAPPPQQEEEDPFAYIDDIQLSPSHEEGPRQAQSNIGGVTLDTISQQLADMQWGFQRTQSRLLRNQELLIRDMSSQFNFDLSRYEFGTPPSSPPH